MNRTTAKTQLQVEELERRDAPSTLLITPPHGSAVPAAAFVASQGCTAITLHAAVVTNGVVTCS